MNYRHIQSRDKTKGTLTGAIACLLLLTHPLRSLGAELTAWQFDPLKTQLELTIEGEITPRYFILSDPLRIILDLPDTAIASAVPPQFYSGAIRQISLDRSQGQVTRLILELAPGITLAPQPVQIQSLVGENGLYRLVIRPVIAGETSVTSLNLPPPTFATQGNQPTVKVPPLYPHRASPLMGNEEPTPGASAAALSTQPASVETRPNLLGIRTNNPPKVTTPRSSERVSNPPPPIRSSVIPALEFGQPLPSFSPGRTLAQQSLSLGGFPSGTVLKLRYPGESVLVLEPGAPLQEVLLLDQAVQNAQGEILLPMNTPVIGRFETQGVECRFLAQAIVLLGENRTVAIQAQSAPFPFQNGLITIEPGQLIEIRL